MASGRLRLHGRRHHVLAGLGNVAQQVAQEVNPAEAFPTSAPSGATPRAALEHPLDRRRQAQVGIGDHQAGASETTLYLLAEDLRSRGIARVRSPTRVVSTHLRWLLRWVER